MKGKPATIDHYLAGVSPEKRAALEKLRKTIQAAAPKAEECISYQIPAFRFEGRLLVGFCAAVKHCSFFPMSSSLIATHKSELKDYNTSKGTIRFQPEKPIPASFVQKIVKARIAENRARGPAKR